LGGEDIINLHGDAGDDIVFVGLDSAGTVTGGDGNDTLDAFSNSRLENLVISGFEVLDLFGTSGTTARAAQYASFQTILGPVNLAPSGFATVVNLVTQLGGGVTPVVVTGSSDSETITSAAGGDILNGGGGNDVLTAGDGGDTLGGGDGNDSLLGGTGIDTLDGGAGNDVLDGGADTDIIRDTLGGTDTVLAGRAMTICHSSCRPGPRRRAVWSMAARAATSWSSPRSSRVWALICAA
jgi:Ca2+-binding RTX toxin-like protein